MTSVVDEKSSSEERWLPCTERTEAILGPFSAVIALTVSVKVLGFAEKQLMAYYFGIDWHVDAFLVASSIGVTLLLLVRELAEPTFVPAFVRALHEGEEAKAWGIFVMFAVASSVVCVGVSAAPMLFPRDVLRYLAPGLDPRAASAAAGLSRFASVAGWFLGLSSLTYMTLNARRRFVWPAAGDIGLKLASIVGCVIAGAGGLGAPALGWAFLAGAIVRLSVHTRALSADLLRLRSARLPRPAEVRVLGRSTAPIALGVVLAQASQLADNYFLSLCKAGAIAAGGYARKIAELPILLVPYALSVVLYPHLARLAARRDARSFSAVIGTSAKALTYFILPVAVSTYFLADSAVAVVFQRGAFDDTARSLCATILRVYSLGLLAFALEAIVVPSFFAMQNTRTPIVFGAIGVLINVASAAALVEPYGVAGVAAALVVSKTLKTLALGSVLVSSGSGNGWQPLLEESARFAFAALCSTVCAAGWLAVWPAQLGGGLVLQLLHMLASGVWIVVCFLLAVCLFPSERSSLRQGFRLATRMWVGGRRRVDEHRGEPDRTRHARGGRAH